MWGGGLKGLALGIVSRSTRIPSGYKVVSKFWVGFEGGNGRKNYLESGDN